MSCILPFKNLLTLLLFGIKLAKAPLREISKKENEFLPGYANDPADPVTGCGSPVEFTLRPTLIWSRLQPLIINRHLDLDSRF